MYVAAINPEAGQNRVSRTMDRTSSGRREDEALYPGRGPPFLKHAKRSKSKTVTFWNSTHLPLGAWVFGAPHKPLFPMSARM